MYDSSSFRKGSMLLMLDDDFVQVFMKPINTTELKATQTNTRPHRLRRKKLVKSRTIKKAPILAFANVLSE